MSKRSYKIIFWIPRILSILFICFLALFSLDVVDLGLSFWQTVGAFLIHTLPSFVLLGILLIAWKWELVGGIAYTLAGLLYVTSILMNPRFEWYLLSYSVIIAGPALIIGGFFFANWYLKKKAIPSSKIHTILFDWGGVLTRGSYTRAILNELRKIKDFSIDEAFPKFDRSIVEMGRGTLSFADFVKKIKQECKIPVTQKEMKEVIKNAIILNSEVVDLAKQLKPKYRLGILSDNDVTTVEIWKKHHPEVSRVFEKQYFSFAFGVTKPNPTFFVRVLKDLNEKPENCLFIDDKTKNIDAAKKIGMRGVLFSDIEQLKKSLLCKGIHFTK